MHLITHHKQSSPILLTMIGKAMSVIRLTILRDNYCIIMNNMNIDSAIMNCKETTHQVYRQAVKLQVVAYELALECLSQVTD